ncbi:MAG: hypothetical protein HC848_05275 [Limnobacter sp.]|nr:hypothetical protein [Limnobacter sp.]
MLLRTTLLLPLDDLLTVTREFINPKTSRSALHRLHNASPVHIQKILTDNGTQFTDRFTCREKVPSGKHVFDRECAALQIEHRLILARTFSCYTLTDYGLVYNQNIPQKALGDISPVQAMKNWQEEKPELFKKRVYKQAGLDRSVFWGGSCKGLNMAWVLQFFLARALGVWLPAIKSVPAVWGVTLRRVKAGSACRDYCITFSKKTSSFRIGCR